MIRNLLISILSLFFFSYCAQEKSDIWVECEATPYGYYIIKWETFPSIDGTVKIFESSVPDSFNLSSPIAETNISKGFTNIFFVQTTKRSYFKLIFNKKYSVVTAERIIPMDSLYNFRDFGGNYNTDGKQTCWGKLYRSSSLANTSFRDIKVLNNLKIKTVIDFRTDQERHIAPLKYKAPQIFNIPLRGDNYTFFFDGILRKEKKAGDIKVNAQRMFYFFLEHNSDYFAKMFDILLDENNYPVLISCSYGRDRSSVASALILAALDIEMNKIVDDYMLTNKKTNFRSFFNDDNILLEDPEVQETFTALFLVHKGTMTYSFEKIIKDYGSLDNFFNTTLDLTPKKRERLKEIMLY